MTIIFDLDGTLLNTIDDLGYACNYALEQTGYPTHRIEEYPRMVGNGINNLIRRALPEAERTEENILRVRAHFVPYYDAHNSDYTRPYEGIPDLLQSLKAQGHHLAVASNKYQAATEKIVSHFFPGIFDVILGEREGIERKPNPQIVYDILSSLNYKLEGFSQLSIPSDHSPKEIRTFNSQLIYVGDSLVDRDTAANANVPFVACSWGFVSRQALIEAGVSRIIDHPAELALDIYIHQSILPQYDAFDGGHRRDHAETVISESLKLARANNVDETMAYVIAAYHDLGLKIDREFHHIHSGEILMADNTLRQFFTPDQLHTMRDAIEDHRASSKNPPRTIYGAIVAEADRQIDPLTVIHRTMAYSRKLLPEADFETLYQRSLAHLHEKYAEGGYMKLWLQSERNVQGLAALRSLIHDEPHLRTLCREWFDKSKAL
jgi:phosphoglycolate phosphatase